MAVLNDEAHALKMMVKLLKTLTKSLGEVRANLSLVAAFYKGDMSAEKPSEKMRLENVVNTHKNGIDKILVKLAKTLKIVHWSKYPRPEMKKCCDAVESLFTALSDITASSPHFANGQLGDTDNAIAAFCSFLTCSIAECDPSAIPSRIDNYLGEMRHHFDIDQHIFGLLTRDLVAQHDEYAAKGKTVAPKAEIEPSYRDLLLLGYKSAYDATTSKASEIQQAVEELKQESVATGEAVMTGINAIHHRLAHRPAGRIGSAKIGPEERRKAYEIWQEAKRKLKPT